MLVFKPIITKFYICWFSNWKLNWKPIFKWAPFENHPTLEKTNNKLTFFFRFSYFWKAQLYYAKVFFLKIWKLVSKWAYTQVAIEQVYISFFLGTTQHWSLPSLLYVIDLCIFSFHFMIFWTTSMPPITRNLLHLLNCVTRTMHLLWFATPWKQLGPYGDKWVICRNIVLKKVC